MRVAAPPLSLAAPIVSIAIVSVSISYSVPLFALLLESQGAAGWQIGLSHTLGAVAMVVSAPLMPRIMARVGIVPLSLGANVLLAAAFMAATVSTSQVWWGVLRLAFGAGATALFFISEFWLVAQAPEATRGRVLAFYAVVLSGCYMAGPVLLGLIGIDSVLTFAIPAAIILAGAIPILLGGHHAPPVGRDVHSGLAGILRFFRTDPLVIWGVVLFGTIEYGAIGLISVWALRSGYDEITAVEFVFWLAAGSLVFQWPMGWAADRFDRRRLLVTAAAVALVAPLAIVPVAGKPALVAGLIFVWGGMAVALYFIALTELGARYRGDALADANAAVVLAYGIGALVSPAAFGLAMDAVPPNGLLWLAALAGGAYLALGVIRIVRSPQGP